MAAVSERAGGKPCGAITCASTYILLPSSFNPAVNPSRQKCGIWLLTVGNEMLLENAFVYSTEQCQQILKVLSERDREESCSVETFGQIRIVIPTMYTELCTTG